MDEPVPATVDASILDIAVNAAINRTTAATRLTENDRRDLRFRRTRACIARCRRDDFPLKWRAGFDSVLVNGNVDIGNCSRIGIYSSEESDNAVATELHICLINTPTLSR